MDDVSRLPPEIHEIIYKYLSADDLWSCLSVNKTWRIRCNSNKFWLSHLKALDINAQDSLKPESVLSNEFDLCASASEWKRRRSTISYWKKKDFVCFSLPHFNNARFYSHNNYLIIVDYPMVMGILILRDDFSLFKFWLPSAIPFNDGNVLMNKDHVIIACDTDVMVYRRDKCYGLHSIFSFRENGSVEASTSDSLLLQARNVDTSCQFSYLSGNKLWLSFRVNLVLLYHVLIDIDTNEITDIKPPLDSEAVELTATNQRIVFAFTYEIIIYDINGRMLFRREIGEFCCFGANDDVISVFKPSSIDTFDVISGHLLHRLPNDFKNRPQLFVSSHKKIIVKIRKKWNSHCLVAFCAVSGKKLWSFRTPLDEQDRGVEITFSEVYGTLITINFTYFKIVDFFSEIYILNIESGQLVSTVSCTNLNILAQNYFIEDGYPTKLFLV